MTKDKSKIYKTWKRLNTLILLKKTQHNILLSQCDKRDFVMAEGENFDEWNRWSAWFEEETRGLRVKSLKKLLRFYFFSKQRFNRLDWREWINRDAQRRSNLHRSYDNYLSIIDNQEIEYYLGLGLFGSERQTRDYWKTLYILTVYEAM